MNRRFIEWCKDYTGFRHALPARRGSTALWKLFCRLRDVRGPGVVILPEMCCETVALAAHFAGHEVRCVDLSADTLCLDPAKLERAICPRTVAVVVVRLFGYCPNWDGIRSVKLRHPKVVFIDDLAQAFGRVDEWPGLDCALMSFAKSKIIGNSGGLLVFGSDLEDELALATGCTYSAETCDADEYEILATSLRNAVHACADLWRCGTELDYLAAFRTLLPGFAPLVTVDDLSYFAPIDATVDEIERLRSTRYENYSRYALALLDAGVVVPRLPQGEMCWRYPVIFDRPELARKITMRLRAAGLNASNHYLPLGVIFCDSVGETAQHLARRIVNLWVDQSTSYTEIDLAITLIRSTVGENDGPHI